MLSQDHKIDGVGGQPDRMFHAGVGVPTRDTEADLVILASCDSGQSSEAAQDELLGLTTSFLWMGRQHWSRAPALFPTPRQCR
jgi:hypothetical protein